MEREFLRAQGSERELMLTHFKALALARAGQENWRKHSRSSSPL